MVDYVVNKGKNVAIKEAYKDLDLNFMAHPITGDVTTKSDSEAVKRAVKNIVLTNCLLYTSPSPRDVEESRMPSSA